ncbi:MAG: aspartate aminotransferase [Flavipsychrobacter sp.]|jgi:aspartate aminotransferase|nr:aspartate aminotransferase [Flavipsychrobacter sp.]
MSTLSQLAESLIGSEIVKLGNEISRRVREGEKIYNYTIGDFDPDIFPIPPQLEDEIIKCYQERFTNYPPADGLAELRSAVAAFVQEHEGIHYTPSEVQIACGGRPLIYALFKTIVDRDDKVIYAVPSWNNNHYTAMNHGHHCTIDAYPENDFMPTVDDIRAHITGAVLLCLCTPQNPTGTTMSKETLEGICDMILEENNRRRGKEKKLYLMFDQMYALLTYGGVKHYNPVALRPAMKDYTIFIDGISKSFAATGVRVGWSYGPAHVLGKMRALLSHMGAWAPMAEQKATANFLAQKEVIAKYFDHFRSELHERLVTLYNGFTAMKAKGLPIDCIAPQAALYLTIKLDIVGKHYEDGNLLHDQKEATEYILNKARLAIVPFYAFGASKHSPWYRVSVGTCNKAEIPEMLALLEHALEELV